MERRFSPLVKGFLGALCAVALVGGVLVIVSAFNHLWLDHTALHQAFGAINTLAIKHPELFK